MPFLWKNLLKAFSPLLLAAYAGAVFGAAGNVQFVIGDVKLITKAGVTRALEKGAEINEGDRIVSAAGASAQLKMVDGGFIAIRPNTDMTFDAYRYNGKEDGTENALVSLLNGGFRTITGVIGRSNKQNYQIKTDTATIGIRGTDHEPMVVLPPAPGQTPIAAPGSYDKVNVGVAFIRNEAGSVDIQANQVGFAPVTKAAPVILPAIPPFYKPTPAPVEQKAKEETKEEGKKETAAAPSGEKAQAAPAEKTEEAPAPIRETAVVDPKTSVATAPAAAPVAAAPATTAPTVPVTMTDASGSSFNATDQTITSPTGTTTPISTGVYATEAQAAADQALASYNATQATLAAINSAQTDASAKATAAAALSPVSVAPATNAINTAQPAITSAQSAVSAAQALAPVSTATAAANATTAASLASSMEALASAAASAYAANGSFADSTAAAAKTLMDSANFTLQTANTNIQNAVVVVGTQNTALTNAQTSAATALSSASTLLSSADTAVINATAQNATLATAQTEASSAANSIPAYLSAAQTAASAAQAAAQAAQAAATKAQSLQSAGDFAGAQAQLTIAQQELAIAQQQQTTAATQLAAAQSAGATVTTQAAVAQNAVTSAQTLVTGAVADANTAETNAATAASSASAAQAAKDLADAAVATTASELSSIQAAAPTIQQNAVVAQYNNPAVASSNFAGSVLGTKTVTGGAEQIVEYPSTTKPNTNYVLDGNKSLVEIRSGSYDRFGLNYSAAQISNANIKFSGGVASDTASADNGTYYLGRWTGGQIDVTDLATTSPVAPFTDLLGAASAHWIIGLTPGVSTINPSINAVQEIVGNANYTLLAATHPTDGVGNVGTLNSATLAANFSAQTVNAGVNLSFSSTDPANVSARNLSLTATASNVPIRGAGFDASGLFQPAVTCTGADCAAGGYLGEIGGRFLSTASGGTTTGAVGTGAGIAYGFAPDVPSAGPNQPFTDFIQGVAVLGSAAAPTVGANNFASTAVLRHELIWDTTQLATGVNPAVTTYIVSDKSSQFLYYNSSGTPNTPLTTPLTTPINLAGPTNNTNYLFDASGNLVRVYDTPHVIFDHGSDVPGSWSQFATPTPLAHAQLSFGGGGATPESYYDPGTSIRFGRWSGGSINVTDLSTGTSYVESLLAPGGAARSLQWVVAQMPSSLPTTGEFHYVRIADSTGAPSFATAPADSYGNVGTLDGARLSADFTNQRVSAALRITMPTGPAGSLGIQNLSGRFDNAPISNGGFNVSSGPSNNPPGTDYLHISCYGSGCAPDLSAGVPAYGGRIRGAFDSATGNAGTADGAFFRYTFNTGYGSNGVTPPTGRVVDDYINGLVAFKQGPQVIIPTSAAYPVAAPTAPVWASATYNYGTGSFVQSANTHYYVDKPPGNLVTDAAGNLVSITEPAFSVFGNEASLTLTGGTAAPATPLALGIGSTTSATDGSILLGWQQASPTLTVSGNDWDGCFGTGCSANPTPRTVLGDGLSWVRGPAPFPWYLPGAIAGFTTSAGVVVPFSATYDLGSSILHDQTGATGIVNSASLTVNFNRASVGFNMDATTAAGNWLVSAGGIRLSMEGSFYANAGSTPPTIISGTTVTPTTAHDTMSVTFSGSGNAAGNIQGQLMGIGVGGAGVTYNLKSFLPSPSPGSTVTASGALAFGLSGQQPYSTLTPYHLLLYPIGMTGAGEIDSYENHRINGGLLSPYRTQFVNNFPVRVDGDLPVVISHPSPCTGNCIYTNDIPVVYAIAGATGPASVGTATLVESGSDIVTGLRWGRYGGGTVGVNDRISGASLGTLDATVQSLPFIISGNQTGPTVLPTTGTFNYTFVGGTSPIDSNGNVGAALTAANASLTANFSAQTVDVTLSNLAVGGNTWGATATGLPITNAVFAASKELGGGGPLTVTSSLGTNTAGDLVGGFTGATGGGVGMAYSLNHGGNKSSNAAAVTVSGVAAFKR